MAHSIALRIVHHQLFANRLPEIGGRRVVHAQSLLWFVRIDSIPNFGAVRHTRARGPPKKRGAPTPTKRVFSFKKKKSKLNSRLFFIKKKKEGWVSGVFFYKL